MIKLNNKTVKSLYRNKIGFKDEHPNLLLNSNVGHSNQSYPTANYYLAETPVVGETYTFTLWGQLGEGKDAFAIYNSSGSVFLAGLTKIADGVYSASFIWSNTSSGGTTVTPTYISVYPVLASVTSTSIINRVKLEKGESTDTYWSPAESELISSYTPNLFDYSSGYLTRHNVIRDNNYGFIQETADSEQRYNWQIILVKDSSTYMQVGGVEAVNSATRLIIPFTIPPDYNNCTIRFKQNGKTTDTGIKIETPDIFTSGNYTLSVNITNVTNGSISFKNLKIERGTVANPIWTPAKTEWVEPEGPFNLLKGSKEGYVLTGADSQSATSYSSAINAEGFLEFTITALAVETYQYRYLFVENNLAEYFQEGETYTFSAEVKSTAAGHVSIDSRYSGTNLKPIEAHFPNTNGQWQRVSSTVKLTGLSNNNRALMTLRLGSDFTSVPVGSTATIRKVCLTKGTSPLYAPTYEEFKGVNIPFLYLLL